MRVVVTGADGFVGRPTCRRLAAEGHQVIALIRHRRPVDDLAAHQIIVVEDLGTGHALDQAVKGADALVHLAARTHVMKETSPAPEAEFTRVNVDLTAHVAEAALRAGLKRFVFVSSVKVNGEQTGGIPFTAEMPPAPLDWYGRSKAKAEEVLRSTAGNKLDVVILRPPLMYGPGMKGNFARLFAMAERGIPLPFASIHNSRDVLSVFSLADLINRVVSHPAAAGRTFMARDGTALSTPQLFQAIAQSLGRNARLFPVPTAMLSLAGTLTGRSAEVQRLTGDLEIDDRATREALQWAPPASMQETLRETAVWWKRRLTGSG